MKEVQKLIQKEMKRACEIKNPSMLRGCSVANMPNHYVHHMKFNTAVVTEQLVDSSSPATTSSTTIFQSSFIASLSYSSLIV